MPKPRLTATTETTVTTTVKMSPKALQMLKVRAEEHASNANHMDVLKERNKAIEAEVDTLFTKEGQGAALVDGTKVDGNTYKLTQGKTKKFDQLGFMKKHGLTQEDFDEFTTWEDNTPYIAIKCPSVRRTKAQREKDA